MLAKDSSKLSLWATLSKTPMLKPFSWRGWKTRPWALPLFSQTCEPSMEGRFMAWWTGWWEEYRANRIALRGSSGGIQTKEISSMSSFVWWARWNPKSVSWKTSEGLLPGMDSADCLGVWPISGSMRNGKLYRLPGRAEHRISESEFLSWPIATTKGAEHSGEPTAGGMWATPTARDYKDGADPSLAVPTNCLLGRQAPRVTGQLSPHSSGLQLNPVFVEWLMGFDHLHSLAGSATPNSSEQRDFDLSETPAYPSKPRQRSAF